MLPNIDPNRLHEYLNEHPEATGWAKSRENRAMLHRRLGNGRAWCAGLPSVGSSYYGGNFPKEFIPSWNKIEDQGQISSCGGNSLTSCGEICERNESRGKVYRQFSRMAAYQISKKRDGIRGDNGMTIDSGVWYGTQHGFSLEKDYPYPSRYPGDQIPQAAKGNIFQINGARAITDTDTFFKWLTTNQGPIYIGMRWTQWCDKEERFIRTFLGPNRNDRHGGGHAVYFYGWTTISDGMLCPILWNSWSKRWGYMGRKAVFPKAIGEMLGDNITTCVGFHWKRSPQPENWSLWERYREWLQAA